MPTYDYHCSQCRHQFEASQKMTEAPLVDCPSCQNPALKRGPGGGIGLLFKGSGFYITDYPQKESSSSCCPCGKNSCSS